MRALTLGLLWVALLALAPSSWAQQGPQRGRRSQPVPLDIPGNRVVVDTLKLRRDSLAHRSDSLYIDSLRKINDLSNPVEYSSRDSLTLDIGDKNMELYGDGKMKMGPTELAAERIGLNYKSDIVTAQGVQDTSGKPVGRPIFTDNGQKFNTEHIIYNFKTKRGRILYTQTTQKGNVITAPVSKRNPDRSFFVKDAKFTTCTHTPPHYYIHCNEMKVIPGDKFVSGPLYMVIEDVPVPLIVPFAFFPQQQGRKQGVLFPAFGEDANRGFNLRNGGYYWPVSPYQDVILRGDIYARGSYRIELNSTYNKLYGPAGTFDFQKASNTYNQPGDPDYSVNQNYLLTWGHRQVIDPHTRFTSNVNFQGGSSSFLQQNSYSTSSYLQSSIQSNISLNRTFRNPNWVLSANLDHNQNIQSRVVTMTLPNISISRARAFPFKRANPVGKTRWYEQVGVAYQGNFKNQVIISQSNLFTRKMLDSLRYGMVHNLTASLNRTLAHYITLTPSLTYNEYWYPQSYQQVYFVQSGAQLSRTNFTTTRPDSTIYGVAQDSSARYGLYNRKVPGFNAQRDFSFNLQATTRIYGIRVTNWKRKNAFRHTITPSIGFSYRPDFSKPFWNYYTQVPKDATGRNFTNVNRLNGTVTNPSTPAFLGVPSAGSSALINFTLYNLFEMKYVPLTDSAVKKGQKPKYKYMNLVDNLGFSTSYNLLADTLKLSPISITGRTNLFSNKISIQTGGTLDPYVYKTIHQPNGAPDQLVKVNQYAISTNRTLGRLISANINISLNLRAKTKNATTPNLAAVPGVITPQSLGVPIREDLSEIQRYRNLYIDFNLPWSLTMQYNISYNHSSAVSALTQSLQLSGELKLTPAWRITGTSGYDFLHRKATFSNISILRDLHCWDLAFTSVPFGPRQSYYLTINVRSSILQDLKIQKRRDWQDRFSGQSAF